MSGIVDVALDPVRLPFTEPVRYGSAMISQRQAAILTLVTAEGRRGHGELAHVRAGRSTVSLVHRAGAALRGVDPDDEERLEAALAASLGSTPPAPFVRAALETAALDAACRSAKEPLVERLGGGAGSVAVNALLTARGRLDSLADRARALVRLGFRAIKVKRETDPDSTRLALAVIREAVGPDIGLRLDLNGALGERDAIEWLATLGPVALEYVEQPVSSGLGPEALARVRHAVPMPIAADEAVIDLAAATDLVRAGACDVLVVKPARVGGPRQAARIVAAAAEAGIGATVSTLYETGIGIAAALHVAATAAGDHAHGLATAALLVDDLISPGLPVVDGRIEIPARPGLGVDLDREAVERYRMA